MSLTLEHLLSQLDPMVKSAEDSKTPGSTFNKPLEKTAGEVSAAEEGATVARELMEKVASMKTKQTSTQSAGAALGQAILMKRASVGDMNTPNGIPDGVVPNKTQTDAAALEAQHTAIIQPMPTSDGLRPTGTINEIFDAMVEQAMAQGAASTDQNEETMVADHEGNAVDEAVPDQVETAASIEKAAAVSELVDSYGVDYMDAVQLVKEAAEKIADEMEKAAAVDALVNEGIDYEMAIDLVKQAADELAFEEVALSKVAALNELVDEGVDFDEAVEWIKQASEGDMNTMDGVSPGAVPNKDTMDSAAIVASDDAKVRPMPTSDGVSSDGTINQIYDAIVADAIAQGAASTDQNPETSVADHEDAADSAVPDQVKTAKLHELTARGVDFDTALEIVKQASMASSVRDGFNKARGAISDKVGRAVEATRGAAGKAKGYVAGKSRMASDKVKEGAGKAKEYVAGKARNVAEDAAIVRNPGSGAPRAIPTPAKNARGQAAMRLAKNPLVYGGLGAAALAGGGAGYMASREKKAALENLVSQGFDFDQAVEMIKQAANPTAAIKKLVNRNVDAAKTYGQNAVDNAKIMTGKFGPGGLSTGANPRVTAAKNLAKNPLVYGGTGAAALGTAGLAYGMSGSDQEKTAAMNALIDQGVDFDTASYLVAQKSMELYGN